MGHNRGKSMETPEMGNDPDGEEDNQQGERKTQPGKISEAVPSRAIDHSVRLVPYGSEKGG